MFNIFKKEKTEKDNNHPSIIAIACLLIHSAKIDQNYTEKEKKIIKDAIIEISDNGTGIPSNLKEKIFEPSFTTKTKGMGLGLSIIKNLINNYKGKISFKSKKGETVFKIKLPLS